MTDQEQLASIKQELIRELPQGPQRGGPRLSNTLLLLSAVVVPLAVWWYAGGARVENRPLWYVIGTTVGWVVVAGWAAWGSLSPGPTMLGRGRRFMQGIVVLAPAALFVWMIAWDFVDPDLMVAWPDREGWKCFKWTLLMSAWPIIALMLMRRGGDPIHPGARGAAIGASVGCCSGVFVDLWCPIADPSHLVLGHILPLFILSAVGLWLGRWLLSAGRRYLDRRASKARGAHDGK